jgi:Leucine-rich repeat (LRR) protein
MSVKLKNIKRLDLSSTDIEDISSISHLLKLQYLSLGYTKIKNIAPLSGLINLKELWLGDTDVTTIKSLFGLKLENLILNNDNVADDEVFNFVKMHPSCRVYFKGKAYNDKKANIDLPF